MIGTQTDHFEVVSQNLSGHKRADERTLSSAAILSERLQRVRQLDPMFAGISFSPEMRELAETSAAAAVM